MGKKGRNSSSGTPVKNLDLDKVKAAMLQDQVNLVKPEFGSEKKKKKDKKRDSVSKSETPAKQTTDMTTPKIKEGLDKSKTPKSLISNGTPVLSEKKKKKDKSVLTNLVNDTPASKKEKIIAEKEMNGTPKSSKKDKKKNKAAVDTPKETNSPVSDEKGKESAEKVEEKGEIEDKENQPVKQPKKVLEPSKKPETVKKAVVYLEKSQIESGVKAFTQLLSATDKSKSKDLLGDGSAKIQLQVAGIKLPADSDNHTIKVRLPHSCLPSESDILLVVKDLEVGIRSDHEDTLHHYQSLLREAGAEGMVEVMPLRQLRVEYKDFETKNSLCNRFERVLVDDRVFRRVPQFLGKNFYKKKKFPVQINLSKFEKSEKKEGLKEEIERGIKTTLLPLNNHGSCASVAVGRTDMTHQQIVDNITATVEVLKDRYPGGWINVRSLNLMSNNKSLPLYLTDRKTDEIGKVTTANTNKFKKEPVIDELSTIPGAVVTVTSHGSVKVKRSADPEWDSTVEGKKWDMKKKRLVKLQDVKGNKGEKEKETTAGKEGKVDKSSKKKKGKGSTDDESDDDLEDMELEYMKKVAEEEEEIERKEKENMAKLGKSVEKENEDSDDEENDQDDGEDDGEEVDDLDDQDDGDESEVEDASDADDDIEAENLVSEDEGGEEEDGSLLMNRTNDVEDLQDEEETPKPKKSKKKSSKKKKDAKKSPGGGKGKSPKPDNNKKNKNAGKQNKPGKSAKSDKKLKGVKDGKVKKK